MYEQAEVDLVLTDEELEDLGDEPRWESTSVIRAADGLEINLTDPNLPAALWAEIHAPGYATREGKRLVCGRGHAKGVREYRNGRRWSYHLDKGDARQHGPSPEHEAVADLIGSTADKDGWTVEMNSTQMRAGLHTRPDVVIHGEGAITLAVEVQYSRVDALSASSAVGRSTTLLKQDLTPFWVAPLFNANNIRERVPSAIFNDMPLDVIRSASDISIVSGPVKIDRNQILRHSHDLARCPYKDRSACPGWHFRVISTGLKLRDMVNKAAAGDLVVVHRRATAIDGRTVKARQFMTPADRDLYLELGGVLLPLADDPRPATPPTRSLLGRRGFTYDCSRDEPTVRGWGAPRDVGAGTTGTRPPDPVVRHACNWSCCGATENVRGYLGGHRCPEHTPARIKGLPEPEELLKIYNAKKGATD